MPSDLDLRFIPGSPTGFTPAGIAAFDDLRPAAVVRELIQNSLDAAVSARRPTAIVRFRLWTCDPLEVPGIDAYTEAFAAAIAFHERGGALPAKAKRVVDTIWKALDLDQLRVLSVLDNGIGLDERRMTALLSDGVSAKEPGSTGTYGNGHSVAIPASDLRYALYGGLTASGDRIGAGHAVLASHVGENSEFPCSGDGFLVRGFRNGRDGALFEYPRDDDVPSLIAGELDDIASASDHGTVVILPAFNSFREGNRSVADMVLEAAASNFFVAIQEGRLEVWVEDDEADAKELILDATTLSSQLANNREKKRSRAFLSGARAYDAHQAFLRGRAAVVNTSQGEINIRLYKSAETTRIDLCRNGMWITDDKGISSFYYKFADRMPFHAVLLLDAGPRIHSLVRDAEGPLHDTIRLKELSRSDKRHLQIAFAEIREWILENTEQIRSDSFGVEDFLALDFGPENQSSGGSTAPSYRGRPVVVKRRIPTWYSIASGAGRRIPQRAEGTGKTNSDRARRSPVLNPAFQVVSLPLGQSRRRIHVTCNEACEQAVLRLRVNENVDATCDSLWHELVPVSLLGVVIDGKSAAAGDLVCDGGDVVGVRLGSLSAGRSIELEAGYRVPEAFGAWSGDEPSLEVEIVEGRLGQDGAEIS